MLSSFLKERIKIAKNLVDTLSKDYEYVSVFGRHAKGRNYVVTSKQVKIGDRERITDSDAGFVIKVYDRNHYSEYSCDDIKDLDVAKMKEAISLKDYDGKYVDAGVLKDEPLVESFQREDEERLSDEEIIEYLTKFKDEAMSYDDKIVEAQFVFSKREVSNIFVSKHRTLDQYYTYNNVIGYIVASQNGKIQSSYDGTNGVNSKTCFEKMALKVKDMAALACKLLEAKTMKPGYYDVITHPSISGLIAHEAFGHGVEMDMFVKNRAKAKDYLNKRVASPLVNMKDGAKSALSAASYFFDDEGVLAHDTIIIKNGILQTGIADSLAALRLKIAPTGNGKRESFTHKAYTRMTTTYFERGNVNTNELLSNVKKGYLISGLLSGMEDPKNWGIQCVCCIGEEIVDGVKTGKVISPVYMSGYVLDLLKSVSIISKEFGINGAGSCGKGYKEWVKNSNGGPYMKARVKIG